MARPSDSKAGYTLLDKIRTNGNQTPFIVYAAGIRSPEHQAELKRRSGVDCTHRPDKLFQLVLQVISQ